MQSDQASVRARRYLLGEMSDEERTAVEREYFASADAIAAVSRAEEDLIEDYLENRLATDERRLFERDYLSTPQHRARVDVIRRLTVTASTQRVRSRQTWTWLAAAAAAVLIVGLLWVFTARTQPPVTVAQQPSPAQTPTPSQPVPSPSPRIVALSLSPAAVRSAQESPALVIPPNTDLAALTLEGETPAADLQRPRAVVRTMTGDEVWRGDGTLVPATGAAARIRVEIPSDRLKPDDYIVTLLGSNASGDERERERYFLRVRR